MIGGFMPRLQALLAQAQTQPMMQRMGQGAPSQMAIFAAQGTVRA